MAMCYGWSWKRLPPKKEAKAELTVKSMDGRRRWLYSLNRDIRDKDRRINRKTGTDGVRWELSGPHCCTTGPQDKFTLSLFLSVYSFSQTLSDITYVDNLGWKVLLILEVLKTVKYWITIRPPLPFPLLSLLLLSSLLFQVESEQTFNLPELIEIHAVLIKTLLSCNR